LVKAIAVVSEPAFTVHHSSVHEHCNWAANDNTHS
jgi:hypothetical protein